MAITGTARENPALSALLAILPADVHPMAAGDRVRIDIDGRVSWLAPHWIGEGFPADVERGRAFLASNEPDVHPVLAARSMSKGARDRLAEEGIPWVDASGQGVLRIPGLYVSRLAASPAPRRAKRMVWTSTTAAAAETLLVSHQESLPRVAAGLEVPIQRPRALATLLEISNAQASRILAAFDEQGYTQKVGAERGTSARRVFRDPGRLLSDWAGEYARAPRQRTREFHVPWRDPERSLRLIADLLQDRAWVVSGTVAADSIAPFLTQVSAPLVYVDHVAFEGVCDRLSDNPDVSEVSKGGRLLVTPAERYLFDLSSRSGGGNIAPAVRVYGDLLRVGGRAIEAADHLRETAIGY